MYNKQYNEFCQIIGKTLTMLMTGKFPITDISIKKISEKLENDDEVIHQAFHLIYDNGKHYFELGFIRQDPFDLKGNKYKMCCDRMALSWSDTHLECDDCGHIHDIVPEHDYSYRIVVNEFALISKYEQDTEEWTILTTKSFLLA
jgi:hypothetical protein